jgi:hypothetical protein
LERHTQPQEELRHLEVQLQPVRVELRRAAANLLVQLDMLHRAAQLEREWALELQNFAESSELGRSAQGHK